jgi:hypothetical protein
MYKLEIQFSNGVKQNMFSAYGVKYASVTERYLSAPTYDFPTVSYPEGGENIYPKTTYKPFDYKLKLSISAPNQNTTNANVVVNNLNRAMRDESDGMLTYKQVTLWDYRNRCMIVGTPSSISQPTTFWRDEQGEDLAVIELSIHVSDPSLCDFELTY